MPVVRYLRNTIQQFISLTALQVRLFGKTPMTPPGGAVGISAVVKRLFLADASSFAIVHCAPNALREAIYVSVGKIPA